MRKRDIFLSMMLGLFIAGCSPDGAGSNQPDNLHPEIGNSSSCSCSDEDASWVDNPSDPFDFPPGVKKPIIYFYPEEEMDLGVTFVYEEMLTTTYPKYDNGWSIHLKEDGKFTVPGGNREYYGLYYESIPNYECTFDEGFYVTKENAASFLEEKMDYMGFTNRETDEFIMYWLPILERNEQSLVYFEQTEERNEESPLIFSTAPDTLIRTCIHIKKVNAPVDMVPQELTHVERVGFTVTEWGGQEH